MKNLLKSTVLVLLISFTLGATANAFSATPGRITDLERTSEEASRLFNRLEEIKTMDATNMSRKEKRELKREVKAINNKLETKDSGGLYISVGAAILIVLLLILIL